MCRMHDSACHSHKSGNPEILDARSSPVSQNMDWRLLLPDHGDFVVNWWGLRKLLKFRLYHVKTFEKHRIDTKEAN